MNLEDACPCGSGRPYGECCCPCHEGKRFARSPEELLRSRYCAYAVGCWDYLEKTHLPFEGGSVVPAAEIARQAEGVHWVGLTVLDSGEDPGKRCPYIDFLAAYRLPDGLHQLGERSYFRQQDGRWYYADGVELRRESERRKTPKVGRNDPCPCGSGKKYKKCCGREH